MVHFLRESGFPAQGYRPDERCAIPSGEEKDDLYEETQNAKFCSEKSHTKISQENDSVVSKCVTYLGVLWSDPLIFHCPKFR
jgi:hypothetical protein